MATLHNPSESARHVTETRARRNAGALAVLLAAGLLAGCSMKQMAVNMIGDAMAGGGGVYTSDNDPELVYEAIPFGLKTYESLLDTSPDHLGLRLAAARGFGAYAYLMTDRADRLDARDVTRARQLRRRAGKLFLRGRDHALHALETRHPGWSALLREDRDLALAALDAEDVPYLYWGGATWAGALGADKNDLNLVAELPTAGAMVGRVLELDEAYEEGAAHEFFIAYEGGRPGGSAELARAHYARALEFSGGLRGSVHLALAEAVTVQEQDLVAFRALIAATLAVDPDAVRRHRLVNTIARRRALWLEERIPDLFLDADLSDNVQ
jgi:hypothetical protein